MPVAADLLEVPAEVSDSLALVREQRIRLEAVCAAKPGFDAKHADSAGKLAQAVKALSTEARLWATQLAERAARATPEQRSAAALQHLLSLPAGPRLAAYRQLVEREAENVQPVQIVLAD